MRHLLCLLGFLFVGGCANYVVKNIKQYEKHDLLKAKKNPNHKYVADLFLK